MNKDFPLSHPLHKLFFQFIEKIFSEPGVEDACMALLNKYDLNPNLLVFCCWLPSQRYRVLESSDFRRIESHILPWRSKVISELSDLLLVFPKTFMSKPLEDIYFMVLDVRRFSEKIERLLLLECCEDIEKEKISQSKPSSLALSNIFNYIRSHDIGFHKNDLEKIYRIVKACF